jgi:hypothetical protein
LAVAREGTGNDNDSGNRNDNDSDNDSGNDNGSGNDSGGGEAGAAKEWEEKNVERCDGMHRFLPRLSVSI